MYIEPWVFWGAIGLLGFFLGMLYYIMHKDEEEFETMKKVVAALAEEIKENKNEGYRGNAEIYSNMADVVGELEEEIKALKKKTKK